MWKKIIFFLDIKKFLYTHEKDEFNDINKHIFEKMYKQKKIWQVVGLNSCPHSNQSCSDPLRHFATYMIICNI